MMKKILCAVMIMMAVPVTAHAETLGRIAAVVNDQIITTNDYDDRLKLMLTASGLPDSDEARQKLGPQILRSLIDETLRNQEIKNEKVDVTQPEIDQAFAKLAEQNNFSPEQFSAVMARTGVNKQSLLNQIRSELGWTKLIRTRLATRVRIDDKEIDQYLERIKNNAGKPEYLLAEIVLPVDKASDEQPAIQLANKMIADMKKGARFSAIAKQFSQSASSAKGGDLGWMVADQLAPELQAALAPLPAGQLTAPVRTLRGVTILFLREKRQITVENLPSRDEVYNKLGMQQIDVMQRRLVRDLRSDAFIDIRL